jgi:hypothetical protein
MSNYGHMSTAGREGPANDPQRTETPAGGPAAKPRKDNRRSRKVDDVAKRQERTVRLLRNVAGVGLLASIAYSAQFERSTVLSVLATAVILAAGSAMSGGLLGFLFGLPRGRRAEPPSPRQPPEESTPIQTPATSPRSSVGPGMEREVATRPNTNLEDISDWLTKILVGVGLTQLASIGDGLRRLSSAVAPSLGGTANSGAFGLALMITYSLIGFMVGYLWTRFYLPLVLERAESEVWEEVQELNQRMQAQKQELQVLREETKDGLEDSVRVSAEKFEGLAYAVGLPEGAVPPAEAPPAEAPPAEAPPAEAPPAEAPPAEAPPAEEAAAEEAAAAAAEEPAAEEPPTEEPPTEEPPTEEPPREEPPTEEPPTALARARAYAAEYERLRRGMPTGPTRTFEMTRLVTRARRSADELRLSPTEIESLFRESDGGRIIALALIANRPDASLLSLVHEAITSSKSAFEQYQALLAAQSLVTKTHLSHAERERLRAAINDQMTPGGQGYIVPNSDRWSVAQSILLQLGS